MLCTVNTLDCTFPNWTYILSLQSHTPRTIYFCVIYVRKFILYSVLHTVTSSNSTFYTVNSGQCAVYSTQFTAPWYTRNCAQVKLYTYNHLESFIESEVPHLRLFPMLSMMPLKRGVANVLRALLGYEVWSKFFMLIVAGP